MAVSTITYNEPVVLLGGGACMRDTLLRLGETYPVIAADGGADHLAGTGLVPDAIIGDLDSLQRRSHWESVTRVIAIAEQDTTDFEKCLYSVAAPVYIALGFTGKRLDHTLASLHVLARYCDDKRVLLVGEEDIVTVTRQSQQLSLSAGCRLSIFPLETVRYLRSTGLRYPLDGLELGPVTMIGTSNEVTEPEVTIEKVAGCDGCYALVLPADAFDSVLAQWLLA
jgi:thiamine pyrophosphokinase